MRYILSKSHQVPFNHRGFMALRAQGAISINNSFRLKAACWESSLTDNVCTFATVLVAS